MNSLCRVLKNKKYKTVIAIAVFCVLIFGCLDQDNDIKPVYGQDTSSGEVAFSVLRGGMSEIASPLDRSGENILREIASRNTNTGRSSLSRSGIEAAFLISFIFLFCSYYVVVFYLSKDIADSHRFILSYIHDLDGMK